MVILKMTFVYAEITDCPFKVDEGLGAIKSGGVRNTRAQRGTVRLCGICLINGDVEQVAKFNTIKTSKYISQYDIKTPKKYTFIIKPIY